MTSYLIVEKKTHDLFLQMLHVMENEALSSSSDEDIELVVHRRKKAKTENFIENTVSNYSARDFFEHFRMSREIAEDISNRFAHSEYFFIRLVNLEKLLHTNVL